MPQSIRPSSVARAAVFAPLTDVGRAELVAQRLSDAIVLGVLGNGEKLPAEADLGRQFGVATVTAREALEALRGRGLVTTRRGRDGGSFVTFSGESHQRMLDERVRAISRVEIRDLALYYTAVAGMAAEVAADRSSEDDVATLYRILDGVDNSCQAGARRGASAFQLEVAALSQSARLVREELRLQSEFGPMLSLCLQEQEYRDRIGRIQHEIVDAIAALDGERARQLTGERITAAVAWLIEMKAALDAES